MVVCRVFSAFGDGALHTCLLVCRVHRWSGWSVLLVCCTEQLVLPVAVCWGWMGGWVGPCRAVPCHSMGRFGLEQHSYKEAGLLWRPWNRLDAVKEYNTTAGLLPRPCCSCIHAAAGIHCITSPSINCAAAREQHHHVVTQQRASWFVLLVSLSVCMLVCRLIACRAAGGPPASVLHSTHIAMPPKLLLHVAQGLCLSFSCLGSKVATLARWRVLLPCTISPILFFSAGPL